MKLNRGTRARSGKSAGCAGDGGEGDPPERSEEELPGEDVPEGESPPAEVASSSVPCAAYDRAEFNRLYDAEHGFVERMLQKRVAKKELSPESARDIHQEVFTTADLLLQKEAKFTNDQAMLVTITTNELRNRKQSRRHKYEVSDDDGSVIASAISEQPNGEEWAYEAECARMVEVILAEMPRALAELFRRIDLDGESCVAIAKEQGRDADNVTRQHSRARKSFGEIAVRLFDENFGGIPWTRWNDGSTTRGPSPRGSSSSSTGRAPRAAGRRSRFSTRSSPSSRSAATTSRPNSGPGAPSAGTEGRRR